MDTVVRPALRFIGQHSALLLIIILVLLAVGMAACFLADKRRFTARDIAAMGMLVALNVVLAEACKITVIPNVLVLSFGFLPLAAAGMLFGVTPAVTVAVAADIIGALLFSSGSFYFGYTLTAFVTGLLYALFLHKKDFSVRRAALCQALVSLLCYALLNSLWALNWVTSTAAGKYIATRLLAQPILFPVYFVLLLVLRRYRRPLERALGHAG